MSYFPGLEQGGIKKEISMNMKKVLMGGFAALMLATSGMNASESKKTAESNIFEPLAYSAADVKGILLNKKTNWDTVLLTGKKRKFSVQDVVLRELGKAPLFYVKLFGMDDLVAGEEDLPDYNTELGECFVKFLVFKKHIVSDHAASMKELEDDIARLEAENEDLSKKVQKIAKKDEEEEQTKIKQQKKKTVQKREKREFVPKSLAEIDLDSESEKGES